MIYLPKFQEIEIAHWKSIIDFCLVNYKISTYYLYLVTQLSLKKHSQNQLRIGKVLSIFVLVITRISTYFRTISSSW